MSCERVENLIRNIAFCGCSLLLGYGYLSSREGMAVMSDGAFLESYRGYVSWT